MRRRGRYRGWLFSASAACLIVASACGDGEIESGGAPFETSGGPDPQMGFSNPGDSSSDARADAGVARDVVSRDENGNQTEPPPTGDPNRPWADNTGPSNPSAMVKSGSLSITTDGATYENLDITGDVWIDASNVTIRNFRIDGQFSSSSFYGINIAPGNSGILLEDGEIMRTGNGIRGLGYTARRIYIHDNNDDGLRPEGAPGSGPTLIEYCFVEKMGLSDGAHADALQVSGVSDGSYDVTLQYNNFYMPAPGTPEHPGDASKASAVIFIAKPVSNYLIQNNWMNGGGYTVYCGGNTTDVVWRNNIFGDDYDYDAVTGSCQNWSGNIWEDTEEPI